MRAMESGGAANIQFIVDNVATGRVIVHGGPGNDSIQVAGGIRLTTILFEGTGNDTMKGGGGLNILVGGGGNDSLTGGKNSDVLIGGLGADSINGSGGGDLIIGGYTTRDHDVMALSAILTLWTDDDCIGDRTAELTRIGGLLAFDQVFDDLAANVLTGGSGQQLYFFGDKDILTDITCADAKRKEKKL